MMLRKRMDSHYNLAQQNGFFLTANII